QFVERVEAEQADRRLVAGIVTKADAAESSRVGHHQLTAAGQFHLELPEPWRPLRAAIVLAARLELHALNIRRMEPALHPEVEDRPRPAIELQPEMLAPQQELAAPPVNSPDPATEQRAPDLSGRGPLEDDAVVRAPDLDDAPADGDALDAPARRLDLR